VRLFEAADLTPTGAIALGDDADNIRTDGAGRLVVGSAAGGWPRSIPQPGKREGISPCPPTPKGSKLTRVATAFM
jgi:hypothetical protein